MSLFGSELVSSSSAPPDTEFDSATDKTSTPAPAPAPAPTPAPTPASYAAMMPSETAPKTTHHHFNGNNSDHDSLLHNHNHASHSNNASGESGGHNHHHHHHRSGSSKQHHHHHHHHQQQQRTPLPAVELGNVRQKADQHDSDELTKRLQKLALERQKQSAAGNSDRLKIIQSDTSSHLSSVKTFQELNLPEGLLNSIYNMGFDRPSAIQEAALPRILANPPRNLIGQAQSGSGKTAAFTLGMLHRIVIDSPATTQALCVTPTRELAVQIVEMAVKPMAAHMTGLHIELAIAAAKVDRQKGVNAHLVVGTPGKVVNLLKHRLLKSYTIKVFVLDEADTMVDESGHRANSILIKKNLPKNCQCLLFSATFPSEVVAFASKMVENPDKILIEDGPEFLVVDVIKQLWIDTRAYEGGKLEFLADIYSLMTIGKSIVFVGTVRCAEMVFQTLSSAGYTCSVMHGSIDGAQRDATMEDFRNGQSNVLITTNVLARGVDVDDVCLVINYDIPVDQRGNPDFETYLHRIGRTGRFGRKGTAINLVDDNRSLQVLSEIEMHFSNNGKNAKQMIQQADADPEKLADEIEIF